MKLLLACGCAAARSDLNKTTSRGTAPASLCLLPCCGQASQLCRREQHWLCSWLQAGPEGRHCTTRCFATVLLSEQLANASSRLNPLLHLVFYTVREQAPFLEKMLYRCVAKIVKGDGKLNCNIACMIQLHITFSIILNVNKAPSPRHY